MYSMHMYIFLLNEKLIQLKYEKEISFRNRVGF